MNIYGDMFVVLHRTSSILIQLMKNFPKNQNINEKIYPLDLDYEFCLVSQEIVFDSIAHELVYYLLI